MWDMQTGEKKAALRAAALSQRNSLSQAQALASSQLIQARALRFPRYIEAHSAALYSPIQNEVGTQEIREHGLKQGKFVFYPRLGRDGAAELVEVKSVGELRAGRCGIFEPSKGRVFSDQEIDGLIVFVPGLAFDLRGNRVGRGMGWYDRLLARICGGATSVALAYDFQVVNDVPADPWDRKVQYIITESRIIDCSENGSQSRLLY
ncbi:MAG: 5-formyltetrahydrofolate cyclo-ligase [Candidatus Binatia bacterium]